MATICKKNQTRMKYIFVAGAPGSKWSSVVKNIYYSPSIDSSDYSDARTYHHDASGQMELMHLGAYFDPGMEFGTGFDNLARYKKEMLEAEFDRPFRGSGIRIIKSHCFSTQIDILKSYWPESPIVLVHRPDDACLGWWVKCGHFDITYPLYDIYYKNLRTMASIIQQQNQGIITARLKHMGSAPLDNNGLAKTLRIDPPPSEYYQNYGQSDIRVTVI
jgi:hypothetical protein